MCKICVMAVAKYYPELKDPDIGELLMSATAFPFGGPKTIIRQLRELKANTDGTLDAAVAYACAQLDKSMEEFNLQNSGKEI